VVPKEGHPRWCHFNRPRVQSVGRGRMCRKVHWDSAIETASPKFNPIPPTKCLANNILYVETLNLCEHKTLMASLLSFGSNMKTVLRP
jgi:hypothetical protein